MLILGECVRSIEKAVPEPHCIVRSEVLVPTSGEPIGVVRTNRVQNGIVSTRRAWSEVGSIAEGLDKGLGRLVDQASGNVQTVTTKQLAGVIARSSRGGIGI